MSRTILFIAAFWLAVPLWGQSGIMPRRSSSIKIPSQETMEAEFNLQMQQNSD